MSKLLIAVDLAVVGVVGISSHGTVISGRDALGKGRALRLDHVGDAGQGLVCQRNVDRLVAFG